MHAGLAGDYNNIHPHVRCQVDKNFFVDTIAGVYLNSENNISAYYGQKYGIIEIGLVTGYSSAPILPLIRVKKNGWFLSPAYEISTDDWGVTLGYETKLF